MTRSPRLGVLALAVVLAATGLVLRPRGSDALDGAVAECNLVVLQLSNDGGSYRLTTANPGTCAMSQYDPIGLPYDAAQTARITISGYADSNAVQCSSGKAASLSGTVSIALDGASSNHYVGNVSILTTNASGAAPTVAFVKGVSTVGSGQFVAGGPGACSGPGSVETWSLGTLVLDEAALRG